MKYELIDMLKTLSVCDSEKAFDKALEKPQTKSVKTDHAFRTGSEE